MAMSGWRPLNAHSFTGMACKVAVGCLGLSHSFLTNLPTEALFLYPIQQVQAAGAPLGGRCEVPSHPIPSRAGQLSAQPVPLAWLYFLKLWPKIMAWTSPYYVTLTSQVDVGVREGSMGRKGMSVNRWYFTMVEYATLAQTCARTHAWALLMHWEVSRVRGHPQVGGKTGLRWLSWQVAELGPGALSLEPRWVHLWFSQEWDPSLWSAPQELHPQPAEERGQGGGDAQK